MRIFESMKSGRAPVIIGDEWCPPPFVNWAACSVRISESDVPFIYDILKERRAEASKMGSAARAEWEATFSAENLFHKTVEAANIVLYRRSSLRSIDHFQKFVCLLKNPYRRQIVRDFRNFIHGAR